jgi:hypothetical protein
MPLEHEKIFYLSPVIKTKTKARPIDKATTAMGSNKAISVTLRIFSPINGILPWSYF